MTAGFFALLSISANAQTANDAKILKSKTNDAILSKAQAAAEKLVVSEVTLKKFAKEKNVPYRFESKEGKIMQLAAIDGSGNPIYLITDNEKAAITSGVNLLQFGAASGYDLSGKDIKILEWDGGRVRASHKELIGKIITGADKGTVTQDLSDHSTHVAGTILATGINKAAKGMAPDSKIVSYDFSSNFVEINDALAKQEGILSTHSYGYNAGYTYNSTKGIYEWSGDTNVSSTIDYRFGYYSDYDATIDQSLLGAPWHTLVRSAGNHRSDNPGTTGTTAYPAERDGGTTGYDCVAFGSLPKNAIIVGAVSPVLNYTGPQSVTSASFSSWGPTDDGRIVPTVVADGVNVFSTFSASDVSYGTMSGTSMATPATTGALTLIQEFAKKKTGNFFTSPLIKSILTNTTKEAGRLGPDYIYGFGLIDAKAAVDLIENKEKSTDYKEGVIQNGETVTLTFKVAEGKPFKATLSWLDKPGVPKASQTSSVPKDPSFLNDRTPKLIDDLDLRVEQNGTTYLPYVLDPANPSKVATTGDNIVDNIEQIYIANPQSGTVTLSFTHKGTLTSPVNYGLAVTGLDVDSDLELLDIVPTVSKELIGKNTPVKVLVKNLGTQDFSNVDVVFTLRDPGGTVKSEKTQTISSILAGSTTEVEFIADASELFTEYRVVARLVANGDLNVSNNFKEKSLLSILADLREGNSGFLQTFNNPLSQDGWKILDANADGKTWTLLTDAFGRGSAYLYSSQFTSPSTYFIANDWLFSNPMLLKAGSKYKVSYYVKRNSSNSLRGEILETFIGNDQTVAGMTTSVNQNVLLQTDPIAWAKKEFEFTATTDGVQYIAIQHKTQDGKVSYGIGIEDFMITNINEGKPNTVISSKITNGMKDVITDITEVQFENSNANLPEVSSWNWTFTPNTVTYINGTSATSEKPQVKFNNVGSYSVKLEASNSFGTSESNKYNIVSVISPNLNNDYTIDRSLIYSNENVQFTNLSSGFPDPNAWEWTITPNTEGAFEFLSGTSPTSEHLNVKFIKGGKYSISLNAKSAFGENLVSKSNIINVFANVNAPKTVTATNNGGSVSLGWGVPDTSSPYSHINELFTSATFPPANWQIIDANADGYSWTRYTLNGNGLAGVYSINPTSGLGRQSDDYLISPVINIPSGYTELSFRSPFGTPSKPDNLKIYVVKTSKTTALTVEEVKAGTLIFDKPIFENGQVFYTADLSSGLDGTPYRLAFYSNNLDKNMASLDNIRISTPGFLVEGKSEGSLAAEVVTIQNVRDGEIITELSNDGTVKPAWPVLTVGPSANVTGYEVQRDNAVIATVPSTDMVYIDNAITSPGTYCYEMVAIYDGVNKSVPSNETCVQVDSVLSTVDMKKFGNVAAFPNPVVDRVKVKFAQSFSGKAEVEIYSADGRKVSQASLTERELGEQGTDMTKLSSGLYILVVKTNGKSFSTKVIKK